MEQSHIQHFSKKILFLSAIFLLVNIAWYLVILYQDGPSFHMVSPRVIFASTQDVLVKTVYDDEYLKASPGQAIRIGTHVKTGDQTFAEIELETNVIRLNQNTEVVLLENHFLTNGQVIPDDGKPRVVFQLLNGSVWVNAFDLIAIQTNRSTALFHHTVGGYDYDGQKSHLMVFAGSLNLVLQDEAGNPLTRYVIPLHNQVRYADSQIIPEYARLQASKLKKELKLSSVDKSVFEDEWVKSNTQGDSNRLAVSRHYIHNHIVYRLKNGYLKVRRFLTFAPAAKRQLALTHTETMLDYLLGGVQKSSDKALTLDILKEFDSAVFNFQDDPLFKKKMAYRFYDIGNVAFDSPAYTVKEHLREFLVSRDHPSFLRTYLDDFSYALNNFSLKEAKRVASLWIKQWPIHCISNHPDEFENQTRIYHRIILSYADRVTPEILNVFDESGDLRIAAAPKDEDTLFGVTQDRLEISSALLVSYRYLDAKRYLKSSYESLKIDRLETDVAARNLFLQQAKLLAQRIEFAQDRFHGAARPIDETEFSQYIQRKTREKFLSENLKAFLKIGAEAEEEPVEYPDPSEAVERFKENRISVLIQDVKPLPQHLEGLPPINGKDAVNPFYFDIQNAFLLDRAPDGRLITFSAVYDYTTDAVIHVIVNGVSLAGGYALSDLVTVLTEVIGGMPAEEKAVTTEEGTLDLLSEELDEEALRDQLVALDIAIQLLMQELAQDGILIDNSQQVMVLDDIALNQFKVSEARLNDPSGLEPSLVLDFRYNTSSKLFSDVRINEVLFPLPSAIHLDQFSQTVWEAVSGETRKQDALAQIVEDFNKRRLTLDRSDIELESGSFDRFGFNDMCLVTVPIRVNGVYDRAQDKFIRATSDWLEAEDISLESYFKSAAERFVIDFLEDKGIAVTTDDMELAFPFETILVKDFPVAGDRLDFEVSVLQNRLKNIEMKQAGAKVGTMTFEEFDTIFLQTPPEEEEEEEIEGQEEEATEEEGEGESE